MQCTYHPDAETVLRCNKCEKPICYRCVIQTPVGGRCKECAQLQRLPQYQATPRYLVRGIGAAVGMGLALGLGLGVAFGTPVVPFVFWWILMPVGLAGSGYAVGRAVSASTNRKRGPVFQGISAGGFVIAALVFSVLAPVALGIAPIYLLIGGIIGLALAIQPFR